VAKKSILMLIGDYVEDYEVMVPFQALLMVGARHAHRTLNIIVAADVVVQNQISNPHFSGLSSNFPQPSRWPDPSRPHTRTRSPVAIGGC